MLQISLKDAPIFIRATGHHNLDTNNNNLPGMDDSHILQKPSKMGTIRHPHSLSIHPQHHQELNHTLLRLGAYTQQADLQHGVLQHLGMGVQFQPYISSKQLVYSGSDWSSFDEVEKETADAEALFEFFTRSVSSFLFGDSLCVCRCCCSFG